MLALKHCGIFCIINLLYDLFSPEKPILNLGVWMPADYHMPPPGIEMVGRLSMGRFGWFTPKKLIEADESLSIIPYALFKDNTAKQFNRFLFDENILTELLVFILHTHTHLLN